MSTERERPSDSDPTDPRSSFVYYDGGTTTRWTADPDGVNTFQYDADGDAASTTQPPPVPMRVPEGRRSRCICNHSSFA